MMRNVALVGAILATWPAGCAYRSAEWALIKQNLVGMSYSDVIACAGEPDQETTTGPNGRTGAIAYSGPVGGIGGDACMATLYFDDGRVVRVSDQNMVPDPLSLTSVWVSRFHRCLRTPGQKASALRDGDP